MKSTAANDQSMKADAFETRLQATRVCFQTVNRLQ